MIEKGVYIMSFNRFYFLILFVPFFLGFSSSVNAQSCQTLREVIINLKEPSFGIPTVWDSIFKDRSEGLVEFSAGLPMDDGTVLAIGEILSRESYKPKEMVMVKLNRRGRALLEKRYPSKEGEQSVSIIDKETGYVAASDFNEDKNHRAARLSWFNKEGDFLKDKIIKEEDHHLHVYQIMAANDGNGTVLLGHAVSKSDPEDEYGMLYRISSKGNLLWKRAYRPGVPNMITGLSFIEEKGHYLASGRIKLDDGRMAGWILELSDDGTIVWQRTYPRGTFSILNKSAELDEGYVLTGFSTPLDGKADAAWVMYVADNGEPIWQRYFRGKNHALTGDDLLNHKDGRLSLLINAKANEGSLSRDHIRLLTLTNLGEVMNDEPYVDGVDANARELFLGRVSERILISNVKARTKLEEEQEKNTTYIEEMKGWVVVATPLDPYEDPCSDKVFR
jgi:hypothetical protein